MRIFTYKKVLVYLFVLLLLVRFSDGRKKKVVIHVPYKVKKIRHTHTVYKTIHHHHTHREPPHVLPNLQDEEHEHFHYVHSHDEGAGTQSIAGIGIPEFLPDSPVEPGIEIPELPDIPRPNRFPYPYRPVK